MTRAGLLATAFLAWSGLAVGSDAAELKKVNFAFNYTVNEAHIAYWVALEKGYYRDKGLDVETQYSKVRATPSPRSISDAPTSRWPMPWWSFPVSRGAPRFRSSAW